MNTQTRPLYTIARDIGRNWTKVNYGAVPYLNAMASLDKITDMYGQDTAKSIVLYFLSNASGFRGEEAKRLKAELKQLAGLK